ncbi:MAG: hypothetical protein ACPG31_04905 [Planctomycetota bacterium]
MKESANPGIAFLCARLPGLAPYALVVFWPALGATHALMLGLVGELLFPRATRPLPLAVRHFVCWTILLQAAPDPYPWWWGLLALTLFTATHRYWNTRPRLCGVLVALLVAVPLADMGMRLDLQQVEGAGSRNPWNPQSSISQSGPVVLLDAPVLSPKPVHVVLPPRATPWYLLAGGKGQGRVALILGFALTFALLTAAKRAPFQAAMVFPLILGWFLLRPANEATLWLSGPDGRWQVLELDLPLEAGPDQEVPALKAEFIPEGSPHPGAAVSWAVRGPLIAPAEGGEPSAWPLLTHWADAKPHPGHFAQLELGSRIGSRRWEIDSDGVLVLRALP